MSETRRKDHTTAGLNLTLVALMATGQFINDHSKAFASPDTAQQTCQTAGPNTFVIMNGSEIGLSLEETSVLGEIFRSVPTIKRSDDGMTHKFSTHIKNGVALDVRVTTPLFHIESRIPRLFEDDFKATAYFSAMPNDDDHKKGNTSMNLLLGDDRKVYTRAGFVTGSEEIGSLDISDPTNPTIHFVNGDEELIAHGLLIQMGKPVNKGGISGTEITATVREGTQFAVPARIGANNVTSPDMNKATYLTSVPYGTLEYGIYRTKENRIIATLPTPNGLVCGEVTQINQEIGDFVIPSLTGGDALMVSLGRSLEAGLLIAMGEQQSAKVNPATQEPVQQQQEAPVQQAPVEVPVQEQPAPTVPAPVVEQPVQPAQPPVQPQRPPDVGVRAQSAPPTPNAEQKAQMQSITMAELTAHNPNHPGLQAFDNLQAVQSEYPWINHMPNSIMFWAPETKSAVNHVLTYFQTNEPQNYNKLVEHGFTSDDITVMALKLMDMESEGAITATSPDEARSLIQAMPTNSFNSLIKIGEITPAMIQELIDNGILNASMMKGGGFPSDLSKSIMNYTYCSGCENVEHNAAIRAFDYLSQKYKIDPWGPYYALRGGLVLLVDEFIRTFNLEYDAQGNKLATFDKKTAFRGTAAAYNGGPSQQYKTLFNGYPTFSQTQEYVDRIDMFYKGEPDIRTWIRNKFMMAFTDMQAQGYDFVNGTWPVGSKLTSGQACGVEGS